MEPSEHPAAFARELREWLAAHAAELVDFRVAHAWPLERSVEHDRVLHRALYDAGFARRGWPVEHGGLGGTPLLRAAMHEALTAEGYSVPESFVGLEVVGPPLVRFAPHLATAYLPAKLRGDDEWCQGFSEPDAGSDLASLRTRAVEDGGALRVDGQKIWTSFGHVARWCALLVRTGTPESRHRGLTMLWLDLAAPGIEVRPIECASGREEVSEVFLDGVLVPRDHVVGEIGRGWDVVMYLMQFERGNFAWGRQAWLHARFAAALAQARASGLRPAGADAATVGSAFVALSTLRARSLGTVTRLARGESPGPEISVDKVLLGATEQAVFDAVAALLGPGFDLEDTEAAAAWRQHWFFSRIVSVYGGAAEVQRDIVAERVLGLPRDVRG